MTQNSFFMIHTLFPLNTPWLCTPGSAPLLLQPGTACLRPSGDVFSLHASFSLPDQPLLQLICSVSTLAPALLLLPRNVQPRLFSSLSSLFPRFPLQAAASPLARLPSPAHGSPIYKGDLVNICGQFSLSK